MGNAFAVAKSNPFDEVESSSFNSKETENIALRYREVCSDIEKRKNVSSDSTVASPNPFRPNLALLLERKGTLQNLDTFTTFLSDGMRINSSTTLAIFWSLLEVRDHDSDGELKLLSFFNLLLCLMCRGDTENGADASVQDDVAKSLVYAVMRPAKKNIGLNSEKTTSVFSGSQCYDLLKQWVSVYGPCIPKVFESYLTETCFPDIKNPSFFPFRKPKISVESYLLPNGPSELIPLSLYCDSLQGEWKRLYSSSVDGISFNRMVHHIMGYEGPICFLIKPQGYSNSVFGAFTSGRWKEFNRFYGASDAFLFTIRPEFKIMRSRDRSNGNYQWLNTKSYGMPHGLALGGSTESFRLFITESFESCVASESCLTFEGGSLLPDINGETFSNNGGKSIMSSSSPINKNNFEIDYIEVFACGGEDYIQQGMKALAKDREIRDENIQKARKVDKAQFFNNAFDQEFLLSGTFAHRTQSAECSEKP